MACGFVWPCYTPFSRRRVGSNKQGYMRNQCSVREYIREVVTPLAPDIASLWWAHKIVEGLKKKFGKDHYAVVELERRIACVTEKYDKLKPGHGGKRSHVT
jgi:hypothetical protein